MPFRYQPLGFDWLRGVFDLVIVVIILAALVWVVLTIAREWEHTHQHLASTPARSEALRILDERFARGEIEAEEYTARRDLLR